MLTIQIPTYRNLNQLCGTISTLQMYNDFPYFIRIVNNDPAGDKAVEDAVAAYGTDNMEVVHAGSNKGWMGAHNMVLDRCDTPFVCLMNDDVWFLPGMPDFWHNLTRWFQNPEVGAVGPMSNFVMGSQNMWNLGVSTISETTLLIGFCVVMRTDVLKEIGGLDETLPGGDDLDYSIRIRKAGYKLIIDKTCFLYHIGQQTGHRVRPGYWDSETHKELTNNALIRKHGVAEWYRTMSSEHWRYGPPVKDLFIESEWYAALVKENGGKGLNLGSGAMAVDGVPGLDIAKRGDRGAGGRKFTPATNDLTADATVLPVPDESLDFLIAAHIFEHLLDPVATLQEWSRVLKPGGDLYASLPHHDQVDTMLIDHTHCHAYVPSSFRSLLESQGWRVDFCEGFERSIAFGAIARRP